MIWQEGVHINVIGNKNFDIPSTKYSIQIPIQPISYLYMPQIIVQQGFRLNTMMPSYQYGDPIPMLKIRRSRDCLIFKMGIPIPEKTVCILRRGLGHQLWE